MRISSRFRCNSSPSFPEWIAIATAFGCSAGGTKGIIDLLKAWVEERKGRCVRLRSGNSEVEIKGGVSKKQIEEATRAIEDLQSAKCRLIEP